MRQRRRLKKNSKSLPGSSRNSGTRWRSSSAVRSVIRGILVGDLTGLNLVTANHLLRYFMLAVVIVVAAVPEGLPMSVALSLSLAMRKMTRATALSGASSRARPSDRRPRSAPTRPGHSRKTRWKWPKPLLQPLQGRACVPETPAEWITLNAAVNGTAHLEERENGRVIVIGNSTEGALLRWLRAHAINYRNCGRVPGGPAVSFSTGSASGCRPWWT